MANLRDIRDRINSVKNTQQITKAMKMVAAARLRKAQDRIMATRPYAFKLKEIIARLVRNTDQPLPLLEDRKEVNRVLFVVVGSDRGLCGGFNNNLFRVIEQRIYNDFEEHLNGGTLDLITVGAKAYKYFEHRKYNIIEDYSGFFEDLQFDTTAKLMQDVVKKYQNGDYDSVWLCFNEFKSVISQNRIVEQVLPFKEQFESKQDEEPAEIDYIYEPEPYEILEELIPRFLNVHLWRAMLESFGSEQGARMAAMDNATENAKDILHDLNLKYNQARQAAITTELSEIVSGADALEE